MKKKLLFQLLAGCTLFIFACANPIDQIKQQFYKNPEIDAFTKAVKVSLPLAYAANCAMDAVNKRILPGVTVTAKSDTSFPCNAVVTVAVSKDHPLPVGNDTSGTIVVSGLWSSADAAVVVVFFTNTNVKDGTFTLKNVAFVPVTRDTTTTTVVFASEDVNLDSNMVVNATITDSLVQVKLAGLPASLPTDSSVAVNQKAWITLADRPAGAALGTETYTLYGASQYLGVNPSTTEVVQAVMVEVKMQPIMCRLNPSSGYAMIRDIKIGSSNTNSSIALGTTVLTFASACDGKASIPIATGVYLGRIGSTTALNLDR